MTGTHPAEPTALIDRWLPHPDVLVMDEAAVAVACARVRHVGASAGLPTTLVETTALLAGELLMNLLQHADGGRFSVARIVRDGVPGLEVIAADSGPGVAQPGSGANHDATALGGLAAVFRLADEVDVDTRIGEGTCLRVRKLAQSPRHRREVGVFGRPCPGDQLSGDDAAVVSDDFGTTILVADGLGHGPLARVASARTATLLLATHLDVTNAGVAHASDMRTLVREAERALTGTRGATLALVSCDRVRGLLHHVGVGDVVARLDHLEHLDRVGAHGRGAGKLGGQSGTVGAGRLGTRDLRVDEEAVAAGDALIVSTDGIATRGDAVRALGRHPIVVAHELVVDYGQDRDDALVVVARLG